MKRLLIAVLAAVPIFLARGQERDMLGNKWPARLPSKSAIERTKADADYIDIAKLPLKDYPLLKKFPGVKMITLDSEEGTFATDEKLSALAALGLTNLTAISLINCRLVTDHGIAALLEIKSLTNIGLEGTAITDTACELMASRLRLTGVDLANCKGVTPKGIKALAVTDTITDFEFSLGSMSQQEVLELIESFKNMKWCWIVDPQGRLEGKPIKEKAAVRKIRVDLRRTGALQDKYGKPD